MPTYTGYHRLIRESRKLSQEFDVAYIAGNEERMEQIAFRQMDVDTQIERYNRILARQGMAMNRRTAA